MVKAAFLVGYGINCEEELAEGFSRAGAAVDYLHINAVLAKPQRLLPYSIFALPGGFSFGDDIASGKVLAVLLKSKLEDIMKRYIREGKLILGICNGAQVGIKWGLFPSVAEQKQKATLTYNASGHFECRWIEVTNYSSHCIFTRGINTADLPVAHGEGRFVANQTLLQQWEQKGQLVLRYTKKGVFARGEYPYNPNGSLDDIAGVCDSTGQVFFLMPHPERNLCPAQHPRKTGGQGLAFFLNAVDYVKKELGD